MSKREERIQYIKDSGYEELLNQLTVYKDGKHQNESVEAYTIALYNTIKIVNNEVDEFEIEPPTKYTISEIPSFENVLGILADYDVKSKHIAPESFVLATFNDIKNYLNANEKEIKEGTLSPNDSDLRLIELNPIYEKLTAWVYGGEEVTYKTCMYGWFVGHYTDNHTEYYRKNIGLDYDENELTEEQKEATGGTLTRNKIDDLSRGLNLCRIDLYSLNGTFTKPYEILYGALTLGTVIKDTLLDLESLNGMSGYGFDAKLNLDTNNLHFQVDEYIFNVCNELGLKAINLNSLLSLERPIVEEEFKACLLEYSNNYTKVLPVNISTVARMNIKDGIKIIDWLNDFQDSVDKDKAICKINTKTKYRVVSHINYYLGMVQTGEKEFTTYYTPLKYLEVTDVTTAILNDYIIDEIDFLKYVCKMCIDNLVELSMHRLEALLIAYCLERIDNFYLSPVFEGRDYLALADFDNRIKQLQEVIDSNF